jgi:hypothetical protein
MSEKETTDLLSPLRDMKDRLDDAIPKKDMEPDPIPDRATIRKEYKKCRNALCECNTKPKKTHGPYLYAYWKDKGKLKKKYIGKNWEEYKDKLRIKARNEATGKNWTFIQWKKYRFIELVANCGNKVAQDYKRKFGISSGNKQFDDMITEIFSKYEHGRIPTIDWAFRVVRKEFQRDPNLQNKAYASGYSKSVFE